MGPPIDIYFTLKPPQIPPKTPFILIFNEEQAISELLSVPVTILSRRVVLTPNSTPPSKLGVNWASFPAVVWMRPIYVQQGSKRLGKVVLWQWKVTFWCVIDGYCNTNNNFKDAVRVLLISRKKFEKWYLVLSPTSNIKCKLFEVVGMNFTWKRFSLLQKFKWTTLLTTEIPYHTLVIH